MRILITAPLRQQRKIFKEHQDALDRLAIPDGVTVDRYYVVNDCPRIISDLRDCTYDVINTGDTYLKSAEGHTWTMENVTKMSMLRDITIARMLQGGYDYWFSVDTDVVMDTQTLRWLLKADKDIVSEVFWSKTGDVLWCNAWMYDTYDTDGQLDVWKHPGLYRVGMTGACTLVKRRVFESGVRYEQIPNVRKAFYGEDRHFCVRAACAGFECWLDTHVPATHLYNEHDYKAYMEAMKDAQHRQAGDDDHDQRV